nr:ABC transporter G family member 25 [Ipomoea batatas]
MNLISILPNHSILCVTYQTLHYCVSQLFLSFDTIIGPNMPAPNDPYPSHDSPFTSVSSFPITLKFTDVSYRIKVERHGAKGGRLRRMFWSGSGPTSSSSDLENQTTPHDERTILSGITGMVHPGEILAVLGPSGSGKSTLLNALAGRLQLQGFTGTVLANNRKLSKPVLKRTGFVAQDDVLYPHLTVRETLIFCALLRLPGSLPKRDKIATAESVIAELGLEKCENTIIGNAFVRGISGGERKRVSIAHEMLINPSLLILDEPTSGLDSTAAFRLVSTLRSLAQKGKTVLTSVHQPSSRVYQMFSSVLVLSEGRSLYFGKGNEAMSYFESVGFSPSFPMNPADFLLDLANGVWQHDGVVSEKERPSVKQKLVSSYNSILAPKVKAACMEGTPTLASSHNVSSSSRPKTNANNKQRSFIFSSTWLNQFSVLLHRGLKERRHDTFNALRVFQVVAAALLAGAMWWHSDYTDVQDRLGLLFFISIFWGVFPSFNAAFAFPQERAVFVKERASGMYTLSSYFVARVVGDLPMELILPTLFITILYWMAGLKPEILAFVFTLLVVLGYVASTVATVTMLAFVLTGGFYVHRVPPCLAWIKYISTTFYCYRLLIDVQYGEGRGISSVLGCGRRGTAGCKFVRDDIQGQIHPATSVAVLVLMFLGYRLVAYLALRRIKA